jgi:hypothetical protein
MKIKRVIETPAELLDVLVNEDVVFEIRIPDLGDISFDIKSSSGFSADGLSVRNVCDAIEKLFHDSGAAVHIK